MWIRKIFRYLFGLLLIILVCFSFYAGWNAGDKLKKEYATLVDDYKSLNHRMNNLEQNYRRVIKLYTLGREKKDEK